MNNNICQQHGNKTITHICTYNHKCQKLMCPLCQFEHQKIYPPDEIIPLDLYIQQLKRNSKNIEKNQQDILSLEKIIRMGLDEILQKTLKFCDSSNIKLNFLFGEIKLKDNNYKELFERHPFETSLRDLHKISNICYNKLQDKWHKQKQSIISIIMKKFDLIYLYFNKLIAILETQMNKWDEEISNKIDNDFQFEYESIQIPVVYGIKHGQTYYKKDGVQDLYGSIQLNQFEGIQNQQGLILSQKRLKLTPFKIKILNDEGQVWYIKDGEILKIENVLNTNEIHEINRNLEQVKHMRWEGKFGLKFQKISQWNAFWQGKKLDVGGLYDEEGFKTGQWVVQSEIYQNQCQVSQIGNYIQGRKQGKWQILHKGEIIGNGEYNQQNIKVGAWVELHKNFNNKNQVFDIGQYINGRKSGVWETYFKDEIQFKQKKIGGGNYDQQNGLKIGQWIENYSTFQDSCKFIYKGNYINGKKEGKWDIYLHDLIIGGGNYRMDKKIEIWKELNEYNEYQILMEGSYKDGKKVGQWVLIFNNQEKGGGCYNDEGLKNGCWTELHEKYNEQCQISIKGQYINGIKSNSWIITYQDKHLGGGDYEESQKTGHWIEVYENFNDRCQIILEGEYIKGQKSGQWITKLRESSVEQFQLIIGQGNYKDGLKIGEWIDIDLNYELTNQITYCGEYQNGRKLGFWQIKQNQVVIGGGVYLLGAIKDGQWVELDDNFSDLCQIFYSGQYKNGIKNGDWEIKMRSKNNLNDIIFQGGGKYLQGVQIGIWRELSQNSWNDCQIIYEGSYENGKKYGKWDTYVQQDSSIQKKTLEGGGQYNIKGLKDGPWIDLSESIWNPQQSLIVQKFQSGLSLKNSS